MTFMLDASAVLAAILDEPGGDYVYEIMNGSHISVVNLSEVYATLLDSGLDFDTAFTAINALPFRIRTFRDVHAENTAKLRPLTKRFGLSLGDRACLTHAMMADLPVLTADRRMADAQAALPVEVQLLR